MQRTLMVMVLSCLVVSPALGQDKSQWSAKYMAGARKSAVGAKVTLSVSPQGVLCKKGKNVVLQFPIESVEQVGYDTKAHSKGWAFLRVAGNAQGDWGLVSVPSLIGAAIAAPFKTTRHFIRILWQQDGEPQEALLEVGKGDYSAVLARLQAVTGKPWQNLPEARKKLRMELEEAKVRKSPIQIERAALVNEVELEPGFYQIILLNRAEGRGEVYFFKGQDVDTGRIAAQAVVNVKAPEDPSLSEAVSYATLEGVRTISSIRLPEKTLSFIAGRLAVRVEKSAHSSYAGSGKWAVVTSAEYRGEPAFLFHVVYLQFLRVCEGQLFVTRTHVALELAPSNSAPHCDTFSALRSEVKASLKKGKWTNNFFSLSVAGKSRSFQPVLEGPTKSNRLAQLGKSRDAAREYAAFFVRAVSDFDAVQLESRPPAPPQL